ncbi:hypothetical protein F5Y07DRAFT_401937 [Xylaria sp. FL0933]|nr:hypothetical protein F5Y07DRAFT_401937 [Xylaria sp. FL0933]
MPCNSPNGPSNLASLRSACYSGTAFNFFLFSFYPLPPILSNICPTRHGRHRHNLLTGGPAVLIGREQSPMVLPPSDQTMQILPDSREPPTRRREDETSDRE